MSASVAGAGQTRSSRQRGGPFASLAMPVNVTRQLFVIPEVRWVHTVADKDFTASSLTLGAGWRF